MNYTRTEFHALAQEITNAYAIAKDHNFGVAIGIRLPYRRTATRIVATAPTYEEATALAKRIKAQFADKIDFASQVWMPEHTMPRPKLLPLQR